MIQTDLILEGQVGRHYFPPLSVRGCLQTLTPLPLGELRRTVQGHLIPVGEGEIRKFSSVITCEDQVAPAFEKVWKGTVLKVGCLPFLTRPLPPGETRAVLEREPVDYGLTTFLGEPLEVERCEGNTVFLPSNFQGGFISYRPWLLMIVKTYHLECDEWEGKIKWRLELEEQ